MRPSPAPRPLSATRPSLRIADALLTLGAFAFVAVLAIATLH